MPWSLRRVLVVLTTVAVCGSIACLQSAFALKRINPAMPAQPFVSGSADAASFDLPKDSKGHDLIDAATDNINAKNWDVVAKALQRVLDDPVDHFASLPRKGADGKVSDVPTSVRAEANRLLSGLPSEGLEVYKAYSEAGPKAAEYLKKAEDATTTDERLDYLRLVVREYLHTDAGGQAADRLASHFMDSGDFRTAARYYNLLGTRAGGFDSLPPDMLFRAAYSFRQTDNKADEDLVWQSLHNRGVREIKFGAETRSVGELQDYLAGIAPPPVVAARQWHYFLGDASHTGRGDGGPAFMWRNWLYHTTVSSSEKEIKPSDYLDPIFLRAAQALNQVNQPVLPPQFPVSASVTMKTDGKKLSLVVYRTHSGIVERDLRTGLVKGHAPMAGSLDWFMSEPARVNVLSQWEQQYIDNKVRPGIFFENTVIGTLSTDGDFAYAVDDLAVPPPPNYRIVGGFPGANTNPLNWPPEIVEALKHNRLMAYDLSAGCMSVWQEEVFTNPKSELSDSYFLGPPLAVNGKLYVLSEKQQEMRLICLENVKTETAKTWKPEIKSILPLGVSRDSKLDQDALRRVNAVHLSYGEGVLVCPTNLGYVIGIDLLQDSLLWAYPYRDKTDLASNSYPPGARLLPNGIVLLPNGTQITPTLPEQGWRASAPIIQDGKVVFTAPDSKSIHCVNLRDGAPVWNRPRQDGDLYLGGVVNGKVIVVGQKVVRAYNLSDGEKPWEAVETGMPTGFGAASDNVYYLPLIGFGAGKDAEICAIDADRGVVVGHSKSHPQNTTEKVETPGNLIFFDGAIISQNNDSVTAYPQMKNKVAQMTAALEKDPNDLQGLLDRGEYNLEAGDARPGDTHLEDAVQDFRKVLHSAPNDETRNKAKEKLYFALTQLFQQHFDQAEKYQDDYTALCSADLPPSATEAEKIEARRRRTTYLCLLAEGKERQRKLTEAFDLYMQLNAEAAPDVPLPLVDEPMVKAAPDVLAQGRIAEMVANASDEERGSLEARIGARWKEIEAKNDLGELRKFVSLFGSLFTVGQQARLQLAERLMDDESDAAVIDAERQLSLLRARTQTHSWRLAPSSIWLGSIPARDCGRTPRIITGCCAIDIPTYR